MVNKKRKYVLIAALAFLLALLCYINAIFNQKKVYLKKQSNGQYYLVYEYDAKTFSIKEQRIEKDDHIHLFCPSFYNLENIELPSDEYIVKEGYYCNGTFIENNNETKAYSKVILVLNDVEKIYIHKLENETLSINLKDEYTIQDLNADKNVKFNADIINIDNNSNIIFNGKLNFIKGRGNVSWDEEKKPYLLSFKSKTSLMELPLTDRYVLIPSYKDMTGLRNKLVFEYADEIGLQNTPKTAYVNVFINGEYEGLYLLSTRVSVGETDNKNEKELPLTIKKFNGTDSEIKEIRYFDNYVSSKTKTYLIEKDSGQRYEEETNTARFMTGRGGCYKIHNSKKMSYEEVMEIAQLFQKYENAVYDKTSDEFLNYIDLDSWVKRYLIEEISHNQDAGRTSFYFYFNKGEDKIYAGPVWDYDGSFGFCQGGFQNPNTLTFYTDILSSRKEFMKYVIDYYNNEIYPNINHLIYGLTNIYAKQIKNDMYLNALRYNQQDYIKTYYSFENYDYDAAVEKLQQHIYEHTNYMKKYMEIFTTIM